MRTVVSLDADTEAAVRRLMAERGFSFSRAINEAIRAGAAQLQVRGLRTRTLSLGAPAADLDHALTAAGDLEDVELLRRLRSGR